MASITLKGNPVNTLGNLPAVGENAPALNLVRNDLSEVNLSNWDGKKKILSIFPSVDTGTCATSVRTFNKNASELEGVAVLNISMDLPFAQSRFCGAEGIDKVEVLSAFRSSFAKDWGLEMTDGPLKGLCSRAIIVLDENNKILHTEQVGDIVDEPNYGAALSALK
ncbi:MAG: thiol peroxidase [Bacteriovoracaceae bacterium]|jgi:thiol peroxidase